jgi:hypothetical protein
MSKEKTPIEELIDFSIKEWEFKSADVAYFNIRKKMVELRDTTESRLIEEHRIMNEQRDEAVTIIKALLFNPNRFQSWKEAESFINKIEHGK